MRLVPGGVTVPRRRPVTAVHDPALLTAPDYLLAGPCVEVWTPERPRVGEWPDYAVRCWTRARNARAAWLAVHGLKRDDPRVPDALRRGGGAWSFRHAAATGTLPGLLARRGLPPDWQPSPAPTVLMTLPPYGPVPPAARRILTGD